jgi:hypothetical protein
MSGVFVDSDVALDIVLMARTSIDRNPFDVIEPGHAIRSRHFELVSEHFIGRNRTTKLAL